MQKLFCGIFGIVYMGGMLSASGESFLKATSFPKTFADLPFVMRMEVLADGYDELGTQYDSNGRCISGCPYPGITIEEETDAILRNTRQANENVVSQQVIIPQTEQPSQIQQPSQIPQVAANSTLSWVQPASQIEPGVQTMSQHGYGATVAVAPSCTFYRNAISAQIPANPPIDGDIVITSDFGPRVKPKGGSTVHNGIDIRAVVGTPVYATADGIIEKVGDDGDVGGGKYIWIRHTNQRFRSVYMHLSDNSTVKEGDYVQAGCLIGKSGNTGTSTGPHLHYGIYYTETGVFNSNADKIDPLWMKNYLGTSYKFKSQNTKSCLHNPTNNFCGTSTEKPTDQLPGEERS